MLPDNVKWYRYLLLFSIIMGIIAGIGTLIFMGATGFGTDLFYKFDNYSFFGGRWWWIPLIAFGGFLVSLLRSNWKIPENVPGSTALVAMGWVDYKSAPKLLSIAVISIIFGASLGPSYGLVVMGGALGSWLVVKIKFAQEVEAKTQYSLSGMAASLGAVFSTPILAAVMGSELSPTPKKNYVMAFIPELIAATLGFVIFYAVTGSTIINSYYIKSEGFEYSHLVYAIFLGLVASLVIITFIIIKKTVMKFAIKINNPILRGTIGGALVGLICFALPLTVTSGNAQLAIAINQVTFMSIGFLLLVLIAKMFAIAISQSSGFLGGVVFPVIFMGGIAGIIVHLIFPQIPMALSVASLIAAVPGALLKAPVGLMFIGVFSVGIAAPEMTPVAIAIVMAHLTTSFVANHFIKSPSNSDN